MEGDGYIDPALPLVAATGSHSIVQRIGQDRADVKGVNGKFLWNIRLYLDLDALLLCLPYVCGQYGIDRRVVTIPFFLQICDPCVQTIDVFLHILCFSAFGQITQDKKMMAHIVPVDLTLLNLLIDA